MRNSSVATVGLAVLCACAVWVSGCNCGSDGSGADGGPDDPLVEGGPDASVGLDAGAPDSGVDAGTVMVDAGTDAGPDPVDAGQLPPDAGAPDAGDVRDSGIIGPRNARLSVSAGGFYGKLYSLAVHDSSGGLKYVGTTWSSDYSAGLNGISVDDGDMVTVQLSEAGGQRLLTFVGVKPGDDLQVAAPFSDSVLVGMPAFPPDATTSQVQVGSAGCSTTTASGTASLLLTSDCAFTYTPAPASQHSEEFAVMWAASVSPRSYFSLQRRIPINDTGTTTVEAPSGWTEGRSCTVRFLTAPENSNPGETATLALTQYEPIEPGTYDPGYGIAAMYGGPFVFDRQVVPLKEGSLTATFNYLDGLRIGAQVEVKSVTADGLIQRTSVATGPGDISDGGCGAPSVSLDWRLPRLTSASHDGQTPRPLISWASEAPMTTNVPGQEWLSASVGIVELSWTAGGQTHAWTFIVPPEQQGLRVPELPDYWGRPTGTIARPKVRFINVFDLDGYDGVRGRAGMGALTRAPALGASLLVPWSDVAVSSIGPP